MKKVSIRFIVAFLLLFSICLIGVAWAEVCNEDENCPCPCSSSLKVYVYDMNTNMPINGAAVEVSGPGSYIVKDYTGSKGSISISDGISLSGEYSVSASKEGYRSQTESFTIEPDECKDEVLRIDLLPECTERNITASVFDTDSSDPINDAEVTLNGPNGFSSTQNTDNSGHATFDNLAEGTYTVSVSKTGYASKSDSVEVECGSYEIEIGLTPDNGGCTEREIKVSVYDTNSNNPIDAEVTLDGPDNYSVTKSTIEGQAVFDSLEEGSYTVSVSKTGYANKSDSVEAECGSYEIEIGLTPDNGGEDDPCTERSVTVVVYSSKTDNPINGAEVTLSGPGNYSDTKSTAEGLVTFENLTEDGLYTVSVSKTGYASESDTVKVECGPYEVEISLDPRNSGGGNNGGGGDNNDNPPDNPPDSNEPPSGNGNPPSTPPEIDETPTPNTSSPPPVTTEPPPVNNSEPPDKGDLPFTGGNSLTYLIAGFVLCGIGVTLRRFDLRNKN